MREFQAAAITAAKAAWPQGRVWPLGEVPANPVTPYLVLGVSAGAPGSYRLSVQAGSKSYRIVVQAVGRTYDETAYAVEKADAAFEDKRLTVPGFDLTPCAGEDRVASPVIRDPDGGVLLSATLLYPFTAYPEE